MKTVEKIRDGDEFDPPKLMEWREYQKTPTGSAYYPSAYSLQWYIRQHRKPLIEYGALITLRGRDCIVIEPFEKSIIQIGSSEAHRKMK
jgi:hypothetical protein